MKFQSLKSFLLLALTSFLFFSCAIETETSFNKNFSGTSVSKMDVSELMEFAGAFGGDKDGNALDSLYIIMNDVQYKDSMDMVYAALNERLSERGLSNFSMEMPEKGIIKTSISFEDIKAINNSVFEDEEFREFSQDGDMNGMMGMINNSHVTLDGKWLTIRLGADELKELFIEEIGADDISNTENMEDQPSDLESADSSAEALEMMKMFGTSVSIKNTYNFAKKIKAIETNVPYTKTKKSITFSYALADLIRWTEKEESDIIRIKVR